MDRVNRYLFSNFISNFASLFSTLFLIMSIVFFIQIARITSYIEINFVELIKLYLFMLPRILVFTTPIAFFVSLAMSFFKLSKENENMVLFTFGYSPTKISSFFIKVSSILSAMLLFISIIMMPIAQNLKDNFIDYKKTQATLNIKPSELGQKFGDWLVFIEKEKKDSNKTIYENLIMYYPKNKNEKEKVILANEGEIRNINSRFEMMLKNGKVYTIDKKEYQITSFNKMTMRSNKSNKISDTQSIYEYWKVMKTDKKIAKDFSIYVLVSLFPLATTFFALSFGIVTYRYEKGFIYLNTFGIVFAYFTATMLLANMPIIAIPSIFISFLILSFLWFQKKIINKY